MKKRYVMGLSLVLCLLFCFCMVGCTTQEKGTGTTTTVSPTTTTTTESLGAGGEFSPFNLTYIPQFSMDYDIAEYGSDPEEFQAWLGQFKDFGGTRENAECNLYTLITELSIPREKVEEYCDWYEERFDGDVLLEDEYVAVLYEGTPEEVYRTFAATYALATAKGAYAPRWFCEHTAEEYMAVGFTAERLETETRYMKQCNEDQREYIRGQIKRLKELEAAKG